MDLIEKQLMQELNIKEFQVVNTIKLIDEGNTIPFIARYRKEQTGELSDETLRDMFDRLNYLRNLNKRKEEVIKIIDEQEKLTDDLREKIESAITITEVEDLYRPYKQKRRTKATIAKEKGLEKLASILLSQDIFEGTIEKIANEFIDEEKEVNTVDEAINGACDIIAEIVSDNADVRKKIRLYTFLNGIIYSNASNMEKKSVYEMYYEYNETVKSIPSHRILAINRGENEGLLKVKIDVPEEQIINIINKFFIKPKISITTSYVKNAVIDSYKRLISPSIEREIRNELTEKAEYGATKVFSTNLKNLLLQPPIKNAVVMGFDPAFRTGCKIAIVDDTGKLLHANTVYPMEPQNDVVGAKKELISLINKHNVNMIAIGNGTASRESETFVSNMLKEIDKEVYYVIVNEAGASIYSASKLGTEEYPDINVSLRGAISIARRLQDPLSELVKIEPKHVGVGQYQHDINQIKLSESLTGVVEDAVNSVGVDLNTASPSLLQYIAGVSKSIAKNIVQYREENGKFKSRSELKKVSRLGPASYIQCAGFLRIPDGKNTLDNTAVHPESYDVTKKLLEKLGYDVKDIKKGTSIEIDEGNIIELANELKIGVPTIKDIIKEIQKPGRDPREEAPKPVLRTDVLKIEDLSIDMVLTGTVRNVIDFGAFVDIGIKNDGLVHISELKDGYVKKPMDVVSVGDVVRVKVIKIDYERNKVSLSMRDLPKN